MMRAPRRRGRYVEGERKQVNYLINSKTKITEGCKLQGEEEGTLTGERKPIDYLINTKI